MTRYDAAIDALCVVMLKEFQIRLGPLIDAIPKFESAADDNQFCLMFWNAAKTVVNHLLYDTGKETIEEDGVVMQELYLHWRGEWNNKHVTSINERSFAFYPL